MRRFRCPLHALLRGARPRERRRSLPGGMRVIVQESPHPASYDTQQGERRTVVERRSTSRPLLRRAYAGHPPPPPVAAAWSDNRGQQGGYRQAASQGGGCGGVAGWIRPGRHQLRRQGWRQLRCPDQRSRGPVAHRLPAAPRPSVTSPRSKVTPRPIADSAVRSTTLGAGLPPGFT